MAMTPAEGREFATAMRRQARGQMLDYLELTLPLLTAKPHAAPAPTPAPAPASAAPSSCPTCAARRATKATAQKRLRASRRAASKGPIR